MRGSREDLLATIESDEAVIQEAEWADIHVGFETYNGVYRSGSERYPSR
jgi:hypothetical protein